MTGGTRACFISASGQNAFFGELQDALRTHLAAVGIQTETSVDRFPPPADDLVYLVVAHEYIPLTLPRSHPSEAQLRRTVVIATEQPGTPWFEEGVAVSKRATVTVDINPSGVAELRRRGVSARRLPLGYVPEWDYWRGADTERPIDATFLGGYTHRRGRLLASCGRVLQDYRSAIHLVETWRPYTAKDSFFLRGERKHRHLASSKVLLNAHREANSYLEWLRLVEAAANGCVVLTEHSSGCAPLVPGEHFESVALENLPVALSTLLDDEDRLSSTRTNAYDFLRSELPIAKTIAVLAEAVDEARRSPVLGNRLSPDRWMRRAPKEPPAPMPEWRRAVGHAGGVDALHMGVKQLVIGQRRLERRLAELTEPRRSDGIDVRRSGPQPSRPRVTVVVTLHNYANTVEEALRGVALAELDDIEVVVVDDASTDGSQFAAEQALRQFDWMPATLVGLTHNAGLPAARNLGIERSQGEYVFILDADNAIYPQALGRLAQALDADPEASFAYGILETFDAGGSIDLLSCFPWQLDRFRYGNYIDAMAMIRRDALLEVGGYVTDDRLFGWEDFALWCAFAEIGRKGVLVPEILGRYRRNRYSMISSTNIDTTEAWAVLVERYPFLLRDPN